MDGCIDKKYLDEEEEEEKNCFLTPTKRKAFWNSLSSQKGEKSFSHSFFSLLFGKIYSKICKLEIKLVLRSSSYK